MQEKQKKSYMQRLWINMKQHKELYIMIIPVLVYFLVFHYQPLYGLTIAFKNFSFRDGIWGSPWAGFTHFESFFGSYYFWRLLRNTLTISVGDLLFGFPIPIILAILMNEVTNKHFKKGVQTITYLPHFISIVVVCGILKEFLSLGGPVNAILTSMGYDPINFFAQGKLFAPIYISSGIWQHMGWSSIIYLSALTNVDPQLYEAAKIDGAGKMKQIFKITIPSIMPTIIIMFILKIGNLMSLGSEKILLLYNETIYEYADTISTFVYRKGLLDADYSYAAAVGLFNSVINFILLISVNQISKKMSESSLW